MMPAFDPDLPPGFPEPWASDWGEDDCGLWMGFRIDGIRQGLRWIPPGTFLMGSPESEQGRDSDETQHQVTLSQGFWLADTACTQALWMALMGENSNPSLFQGKDRPVETVRWDDVQEFLWRLNQSIPDLNATLPTEAQWEYACRAGTTSPFSFGETMSTGQANFDGNHPYRGQDPKGEFREETVAVKVFPPNDWGLYQMHGNVWEWCRDGFREHTTGSVVDPLGSEDGPRVLRGGSWLNLAGCLRCACRDPGARAYRDSDRGFRLSRGPELQASAAEPLEKARAGERRAEPPRSGP
ncbi:MAG: formylglycine-generating enzyme family protein [Methylococcales bacterium]